MNSPKQSTKIIAFKKQYESADPLYKNLKIIKFQYLLRLNNCLFRCQNKKLGATFPRLVYAKEKYNYNTRSARKNLLNTPLCQIFTSGTQSCKYQCIKDWNRFKKKNSTENLTYPIVKIYSKRIFRPPISISLQILGFLLLYFLQNYRTNRERSVMLYFFIIFFIFIFYF